MTTTGVAAGRRIAGLDVIRGIAVGLVVLRHAWPGTFGGAGIAGVVIFFALSGYLITGLLVDDIGRYERIRYRRFYLHRVSRLYPPLLLMLVGFAVVCLTYDPTGSKHLLPRSLLVGGLYLADLPKNAIAPDLGHLWTLAIEEQFYLVWPALLLAAIRRNKVRHLLGFASAAVYLLMVGSLVVASPHYVKVYTFPTTWSIVMLIGASARLEERWLTSHVFVSVRRCRALAAASLLGIGIISGLPEAKNWLGSYLLLGPLLGAFGVALIYWMRSWREVPAAWVAPLMWLGMISYAVYLWDYPIVEWLSHGSAITPLRGLLSVPLTLGAATVSYFSVERWSKGIRRRLDARRAEPAPAV